MKIRTLLAAAAIALAPALIAPPAAFAEPPVYTGAFDNIAVQGYDPVAYFKEGKPVKGSKDFTVTHEGAEFRFANAASLAKFKANPAAYAPQYGGYCAWAVAGGYTAKGDPLAWKVVNGKLYLNYDQNVQKRWAQDIPGNVAKGDKNWPRVLK